MADEPTGTSAPEPTVDAKGRPFITRKMMAAHDSKDDVWMSIHNKVYDVTKYLEDHPGGEEVLLDRGGKDATEDYEDVGHSNEARKQLAPFEIGELPPSEREVAGASGSSGGGGGTMMMAIPVLLLAIGAGYYFLYLA